MQFEKKMSPNDGATIALKPKSSSAHGACSRDEPQPKFLPRDQDRVRLELDLAVAEPVVEEELAEARALDALQELLGDDLVGVDVGAVEHGDLAFDHVHGIHGSAPIADVDEVALDRGRCGHLRAHEVGAPALALAALEVAVRRRGAALARG